MLRAEEWRGEVDVAHHHEAARPINKHRHSLEIFSMYYTVTTTNFRLSQQV
jgi:hypothetical protein